MFRSKFYIFTVVFFLTGCAVSPSIQPTINGLVSAGQYQYAAHMLDEHKDAYGPRNELLYLLDAGMVYHLSGQYKKSIDAFNASKKVYEQVQPRSISQEIDAIVFNDNRIRYRGEVYERILVNVFQALNYAMIDQYSEALVELRDADVQFRRWQSYGDDDNEVYHYTEAFIRFFSGLIYEEAMHQDGLQDALIDYEKAKKLYQLPYKKIESAEVPMLLAERLKKIQTSAADSQHEMGTLFVITYEGVVPIKYEQSIPVPVDGILTKIAVPVMGKRGFALASPTIEIKGNKESIKIPHQDMPALNVSEVALVRHRDKMKVIIPKTIARVGAKMMAQRQLRAKIEEEHGDKKAQWFAYASGLYNYVSESADLRSWQSLPAAIHVSRVELPSGEYSLLIDGDVIHENVRVDAGQTHFVVGRKNF